MKRLTAIVLLLACFNLHAQTNLTIEQFPTGVATSTNGVLSHLTVNTNASVSTRSGAVLDANATPNSATHSNFGVSTAWLAFLIPVLLAFAKGLLPNLPPKYLPLIAIVLGAASDALASYLSGNTPNPALGAVLGSAGVGIRELVDQLRNVSTPTVPVTSWGVSGTALSPSPVSPIGSLPVIQPNPQVPPIP